jgi:hypothetical protein
MVPSEAHHLRGIGHLGGMGLKAPDLAAMPLCSRHHRALHDSRAGVERQFEWAYKTLRKALSEGALKPRIDDLDSTLATLQGRDFEALWRALSGLVEEAG